MAEPIVDEVVAAAEELRTVPEEFGRYADLKPHPANYQEHPPDQIEHLKASIREFGVVKNVVVAEDGITLIAGHGTVEAALELDPEYVGPFRRLDVPFDDPKALKFLALDNELNRFAVRHDRKLTELLRAVAGAPTGLFGTGYDEKILANLVMITRPAHEIADANEAAEWVGMPAFTPFAKPPSITISFDTVELRDEFEKQFELIITRKVGDSWTCWWPPRPRDDSRNVSFDG